MPDLSAATALHGRRLLVIEDDFLIADTLRDELIEIGVEVIGPVPTVVEALCLIDTVVALDGALLDVNLGGETVFPVADVLRQRGIPCVFVTGYDRQCIPAAYADIPLCEKPTGARQAAGALGFW